MRRALWISLAVFAIAPVTGIAQPVGPDKAEVRRAAAVPVSPNAVASVRANAARLGIRRTAAEGSNNWLARALQRLANLFKGRSIDGPDINPGALAGAGQWLTTVVWILLGGAAIAAAAFVIARVRSLPARKRKTKAVLDEDEPVRTADEWLALADAHAAAGRFRDAIRALYLASLVRFDVTGVARFDRSQTNWEHLARIESSPTYDRELDFRSATLLFDRHWYGEIPCGQAEVERLRSVYLRIPEVAPS